MDVLWPSLRLDRSTTQQLSRRLSVCWKRRRRTTPTRSGGMSVMRETIAASLSVAVGGRAVAAERTLTRVSWACGHVMRPPLTLAGV